MISFWISGVPASMVLIRLSMTAFATGYSIM